MITLSDIQAELVSRGFIVTHERFGELIVSYKNGIMRREVRVIVSFSRNVLAGFAGLESWLMCGKDIESVEVIVNRISILALDDSNLNRNGA